MSIPSSSCHKGPKLAFLQKMLNDYDPKSVSTVMSPTETMVGDNYMWVGETAAEIVIASVMSSQLLDVKSVLDLASGHGRVLRHLVKLFPSAHFDVSDLDSEGLAFCSREFGASAIPASPDLTQTPFTRKYDVIWIGSLFTHLSWEVSQRYLEFITNQLSGKGIIIATFHGRWALRMHELIPYTDDERWQKVVKGFMVTGYGYVDYAPGLGHDFVPGSYGVSATRADFLMKMIQEIPGVRIYHYQEKAWGENQDVIAFGRPAWSDLPESWPQD